jgi:hypothetical protein
VLADRRLDLGVLGRVCVVRTLAVADGEDVELDALALFGVHAVDDDAVAGAHLVLLPAHADDRVCSVGLGHFNSLKTTAVDDSQSGVGRQFAPCFSAVA